MARPAWRKPLTRRGDSRSSGGEISSVGESYDMVTKPSTAEYCHRNMAEKPGLVRASLVRYEASQS